MNVNIDKSWERVLNKYFTTTEFIKLANKIREEYMDKNKIVYPHPSDLFRAFNETPFDAVKIVILGQDPYHGDGQAHGLCFSVPQGVEAPPSLQNIFKEIASDIGRARSNTDLTDWAQQGVFLLNAILTVLRKQPASHRDIGWEDFTDFVIKTLSDKREHIVFMLWGNFARSKKHLIDTKKHLVLEAPHPSPLSAHRGFFGCKHFSKANKYLLKHGKNSINW